MSSPAIAPPQGVNPAPASFWRIVLASLKGQEFDYTTETLNRSLLLLAVPMVLEMIMESLFAVVDIFWVSRLGSDAIAVVGITESVMTLVYAVAIGMSIAATAIVSRRVGERDVASAAQAAGQILVIGVASAALLGLVLGVFADRILELMGAGPEVVAMGTDFARLMLGGNITVFLIFLINAVFRGAGDPALAMRTLWLANAINIVLGPFFIFGWGPFPELGVTGAAVATNIGRGIGVLYQLWHLTRGRSRVRVQWVHLRPLLKDMRTIMTTAASGIGQLLITTTSWVGLFKILAASGSAALAGYTIAIRIVVFALMPASGLANAGSTLVGQNLGAKQPERAAQAIRVAALYNVLFLALFGVAFIAFSRPLVGLFTSEPEVLRYGTQALWIVSLAFPMYAAGMCFEAAFNGAGDTWTPTWLNFFCLWLGQIPLAWLLAYPLGLGPIGVFIAVPISFSVLTAWTAVLFRRGRWQAMQI
jgi:putative MATE family efflux protein